MEVGRVVRVNPPSYAEASGNQDSSFCASFVDAFKDPILVMITLATAIGSFCLLSGLILLCLVSQTLNDPTSEAILLVGIGFFITSVACVSWKLTNRSRIKQLMDALKDQPV